MSLFCWYFIQRKKRHYLHFALSTIIYYFTKTYYKKKCIKNVLKNIKMHKKISALGCLNVQNTYMPLRTHKYIKATGSGPPAIPLKDRKKTCISQKDRSVYWVTGRFIAIYYCHANCIYVTIVTKYLVTMSTAFT